MPSGLHLEDRPGGVRILTISNPRKANALDSAMLRELKEALSPERGAGVRALLVQGEGAHFCSGFDLAGLESIPSEGPLPDDALQEAFAAVEAYPAVTVACVRGAAFGAGCELALACDLRVAAEEAKLALPEVGLGLLPAAGGTQRLTALCGAGVARRLILGGETVDGEEAQRLGLVQWARPAADLAEWTAALAARIAAHPRDALAANKRCIALAGSGAGFAAEIAATRALYSSPQTLERVSAFLDRPRTAA